MIIINGTVMNALNTVRHLAKVAGWTEAQDDTDRAHQEIEFRKIRQYVRVRYDVRGRILSATSDNRWLPSKGTYAAVCERLLRDAKNVGKP